MKDIKLGLERLNTLISTCKVNKFDEKIIRLWWQQTRNGTMFASLSGNQIEYMTGMYKKYFKD